MLLRKTVISSLVAALALLLGTACNPLEQSSGAVTVILSSSLPETRGSAEIADGTEIYFDNSDNPDLILLLFNAEGTLVAKYPDPGHASLMDSPTPQRNDMMVRITKTLAGDNIPGGVNYSLYAIANSAGLWDLTDGTNAISAGALNASSITSKTQADLLYFDPLFAADSPSKPHPVLREAPNNRMPLTAMTTLTVSDNGNGSAEILMQRCVSQVVVRFVNNYSQELTLNDFSVTFKNLNTSTGYLFQHNPDIPAGVVYADLVKSETPVTLPDNTNPANRVTEYSALVFPGASPEGAYSCDISFIVAEVGGSPLTPTRRFDFTDLPVHNRRGEDISSLSRNQQLTITVTINQGEMLSFSFEVGEWEERTETVSFD